MTEQNVNTEKGEMKTISWLWFLPSSSKVSSRRMWSPQPKRLENTDCCRPAEHVGCKAVSGYDYINNT